MARYVISRFAIPAAVVAEAIDLKCCKRTELPIYVPEGKIEIKSLKESKEKKSSALEENVRLVRKTVQSFINELRYYEEQGEKYVNEGINQADWLIKYLGEEDNIAPKGPAIALGGLTGFIFAVRGGLFKKVVFTTTGALGMAALCYPKEAAHYTEVGLKHTKQYVTIAYNFIYGDRELDKVSAELEAELEAEMFGTAGEGEGGAPDPMALGNVVMKAHEEAIDKKCHCPIGACLHPKENEEAVHPPDLPYPPPVPPTCAPAPTPQESCMDNKD